MPEHPDLRRERVLGRRAVLVGVGLFIFMIGLASFALTGGGRNINWANYSNLSGTRLSTAQLFLASIVLIITGLVLAGIGLVFWHRARGRLPP